MTTRLLFLAALCVLAGSAAAGPTWKNGLPANAAFFPIAVWLQSPSNAARYKAAGINVYIGLWQGPTEEQLKALKAAGMPVICDQSPVGLAHKDDPTIVGWMHGDEPDNAQPTYDAAGKQTGWGACVPPARIVADYERMRAADPTRPIMLNLGQGVANDEWYGRGPGAKLSDYETFVKGGDIISFDVYPVAGLEKPNGEDFLWYVPKGLDRLAKWTDGQRILWNCIECTNISSDRRPAPEHVRSEVWMSLIHGSKGLIYFVHRFKPTFSEWGLLDDPEMLAAVTAINKQIHSLAPVLNSPAIADGVEMTSGPSDTPVDAMVRRHDGATYLFAAAMRKGSARPTFALKGLPARAEAEVLGEGRRLEVKDGRFADDFAPFAVHLYRIAGR